MGSLLPRVADRVSEGPPLPPGRADSVTLHDGTALQIRLIRPDDGPRLEGFYSRLSTASLYYRFLDLRRGLSDKELKQLAEVDYETHPALVATRRQADTEYIVGDARYAMIETAEPGLAELSIVVEDGYQGRGLGTHLLRRLIAHARANGVHTFLAVLHPENAAMLRLVKRTGLPTQSTMEWGAREIRIGLTPRYDREEPESAEQRGGPFSARPTSVSAGTH